MKESKSLERIDRKSLFSNNLHWYHLIVRTTLCQNMQSATEMILCSFFLLFFFFHYAAELCAFQRTRHIHTQPDAIQFNQSLIRDFNMNGKQKGA